MITVEKSIIQSLALFMATSDIRYYLCGINVQSQGKTVRLQATNGHCAAIHKILTENELEWDFTIPHNVISHLLKGKPLVKSSFIQITPSSIGYCYNQQVNFEPLEGVYPDIAKVWPKDSELTNEHVQVNPDYYALLGKVGKFQGLESRNLITWAYKDRLAFRVGDILGVIMGLRKDDDEPTTIEAY